METGKDRETELLSASLLPKWLLSTGLYQVKVKSFCGWRRSQLLGLLLLLSQVHLKELGWDAVPGNSCYSKWYSDMGC